MITTSPELSDFEDESETNNKYGLLNHFDSLASGKRENAYLCLFVLSCLDFEIKKHKRNK